MSRLASQFNFTYPCSIPCLQPNLSQIPRQKHVFRLCAQAMDIGSSIGMPFFLIPSRNWYEELHGLDIQCPSLKITLS